MLMLHIYLFQIVWITEVLNVVSMLIISTLLANKFVTSYYYIQDWVVSDWD